MEDLISHKFYINGKKQGWFYISDFFYETTSTVFVFIYFHRSLSPFYFDTHSIILQAIFYCVTMSFVCKTLKKKPFEILVIQSRVIGLFTSDANHLVNDKSHAREKPLLAPAGEHFLAVSDILYCHVSCKCF